MRRTASDGIGISIAALRKQAVTHPHSWPQVELIALLDAADFLGEIAPESAGAHKIVLTPEQAERGKRIVARFDFGPLVKQ